MSHFDQYLADFALSGNRYNLLPRLTASGKASGMSADEIVARVRAVGVHDRDADIRRLFNGSKADPSNRSTSWRPPRPFVPYLTREERDEARRRLLPKSARDFTPATLRNYCRTTAFSGMATCDAFAESIRMSEADYLAATGTDNYQRQAARQLRSLFHAGDLIWAGWIGSNGKRAFDGRPLSSGGGIVSAYDLADRIEAGDIPNIPTHASLQPTTGKPDANGSFDSAATIAAYRHALLEWDNLFDIDADGVKTPSEAHIDIIAGLADYSFENPDKLLIDSMTYTGGKSIHVALRVKAEDVAAYKRQTAALRDLFASADDPNFRADPSGWNNGYTHIRLAGAIRLETGRRARPLIGSSPAN